MPRAGLTAVRVVTEAEAVADEVGLSRLTLAAVAGRLGVRLPSLYKHVAGLDELERSMTARAKREFAAVLGRATVGRSGGAALAAMCRAYRGWAAAHPGRYPLTVRAPRQDDPADIEASDALLTLVVAILAGYRLTGTDAVDAIRSLRAALHGFVDLERAGGFGLAPSVDDTFERLITAQHRQLDDWPAATGNDGGPP
jgi:AcrR family transcriptional regulator